MLKSYLLATNFVILNHELNYEKPNHKKTELELVASNCNFGFPFLTKYHWLNTLGFVTGNFHKDCDFCGTFVLTITEKKI